MPDTPKASLRQRMGGFAPRLVDYTEHTLFGDVWKGADLGLRDRSLITVAALVAGNRTEQLRFHIPRAVENGVTPAEIVELITHLAFYAGWPAAMPSIAVARELLAPEA